MLNFVRQLLVNKKHNNARRERFSAVYDNYLWEDTESRSGPGSNRSSGCVRHSIDMILKVVSENKITSINDVPCGDLNWMPEVLARLPGIKYTGFDIVPQLIAKNKQTYPGLDFQVLDIVKSVPSKADLIFCKDLFGHLSEWEVKRTIENMRLSGCTFLLISNNPGYKNCELPPDGGPAASRHLDLLTPPYNFKPPIWATGYLAFWRLADIY